MKAKDIMKIKKVLLCILVLAVFIFTAYLGYMHVFFYKKTRLADNVFSYDNITGLPFEKNNENVKTIENKRGCFTIYEYKGEKFLIFKVVADTYTDSVKIVNLNLRDMSQIDGRTLSINLDYSKEEGNPNPYRDWPLTDVRYIVIKTNEEIEMLYVNESLYNKI